MFFWNAVHDVIAWLLGFFYWIIVFGLSTFLFFVIQAWLTRLSMSKREFDSANEPYNTAWTVTSIVGVIAFIYSIYNMGALEDDPERYANWYLRVFLLLSRIQLIVALIEVPVALLMLAVYYIWSWCSKSTPDESKAHELSEVESQSLSEEV